MKTRRWPAFFFFLAIAIAFVAFASHVAFSQQVAPAAPAAPAPAWPLEVPPSGVITGIDAGTDDLVADIISALAVQHPNIAIALAVIGALRLLIKPVVAAAHALADAGGVPKHQALLARVESSPTFKAFLFLLDWLASIKFRR